MTEAPQPPRTQRIRLGAELRRLRKLAGQSGREVSRRTGISQANVSRIETGQVVPSLPQVAAWCEAIQAPEDVRERLAALTEAALNEVETFRAVPETGLAPLQQDVRELESTTRTLRNFQPSHVPGLLQTAEYARHVLEMALAKPPGDIAAAVDIRLERQSILADPARRFEFILTEAALRWSPVQAEPGMLAAQLDRIVAMAGLANVSIGVIPVGTPTRTVPQGPFVLYDERYAGHRPFVVVEMPHAAVYVNDPGDIEVYRDQIAALRQSALTGADAVRAIRAIAAAL